MPELETKLHTDQLAHCRRVQSLPMRIARAIYQESTRGPAVYGLQWGDPDSFAPLKYIRDRFVLPFVNPNHVAVDIGCGGGRWTRYLLGFKSVYAVDYYSELVTEFHKTFSRYKNVEAIKNNGDDFPGIPSQSVDYILSFGTFGHIELPVIKSYLTNIKAILKSAATS
jgi:SAM-dependent methyltransferase